MTDFDTFDRRLAAALRSDADRVIATFDPASIARAAIQLDHTNQGRALRVSRRIATMNVPTRWAAAAVTAVLAVGGAFYLLRPSQPSIGTPSPTPGVSSSPIESATPSATTRAASWTATGSMATPRAGHTATLLHDGRVFVTHESHDANGYPAEVYDPTTGSWTAAGKSTFGEPWSVTLLDGRVLAGSVPFDPGTVGHLSTVWHTELYDPGTGSWTTTGSMVAHQGGETVTLLLDGRVLAAGGIGAYDAKTGREDYVASAELYDPGTGSWTATRSMIEARSGPTATRLRDGRVLVAGGYFSSSAGNEPLASAELFDPATGTWTATGAMNRPYSHQVAAALADGRVLVIGAHWVPDPQPSSLGGCDCRFVSDVELYDPASGTWTATGTMALPRERFTATLLPDGTVLVVGGVGLVRGDMSDALVASAERYDPSTGSWTATAAMAVARAGHTATLLLDGTVLVVGGEGGGTSAELYDPGSP